MGGVKQELKKKKRGFSLSKHKSLEDKCQSEEISKNFRMGKSSFHDQLQPFPFAPCWTGGLCDTNSKQVFCVYSCLSLVESPHHCTNADKRCGIRQGRPAPRWHTPSQGLMVPHAWGRGLLPRTGTHSFCPLPPGRAMLWLNVTTVFWRGGDISVTPRAKYVPRKCRHLGIWVGSICTRKQDNN